MGCTASPIDFSKISAVPENEGGVFGRLMIIYEGQKLNNLITIFGERKFHILLLPEGSSEPVDPPLENDGYFFWHLPPGTYTIATFEGSTPEFGSVAVQGRLFVDFRVINNTVSYIGTLRVIFKQHRYGKDVQDDYDEAIKHFSQTFPHLQTHITRNLMTVEAER